jgi:hypothetical protein
MTAMVTAAHGPGAAAGRLAPQNAGGVDSLAAMLQRENNATVRLLSAAPAIAHPLAHRWRRGTYP